MWSLNKLPGSKPPTAADRTSVGSCWNVAGLAGAPPFASDRAFLEAVLKPQIYQHAARASESSHCKIYSLARRAGIDEFTGAISGHLFWLRQKSRLCQHVIPGV